MTPLDPEDVRWIAWRNEKRGKEAKLTKVPYGRGGRPAKADDEATWLTRAEAETLARRIVNGQGGGIGYELGDVGNDLFIAGIDLDACLHDGTLAAWAAAILDVGDTYAEASPSGNGVKLFHYLAAEDVRWYLDLIGVPANGWGCRRDVPGEDARDHGPAIEVYCKARYFAVTENRWPSAPDRLRLLDRADLERLTGLIPQAKSAGSGKTGRGDNSRSAAAFRKGKALRRAGKSFEEMRDALQEDPETAEWCRDKGEANGGRELRRIWDKANDADDLSPEYSDDALALEFSSRYAAELRYCHQWGAWLQWDGVRWKFEKTLKTFDLARSVAREFASTCPKPNAALRIASASTVAAVERLARSDRRHATETAIWDTDHWLLNTPGGIVELRSGTMLPHDPDRYITKITAAAPSGVCPRWTKFLEEITGGEVELQQFLQRIAGYSLTGSTREHALFFFYGTGGNGKGVFLNTIAAILADYAAVAPMESFVITQGERHPTDLAGLRGARLVTSQETEEGRRWAESKVKALTGGDPITARFMKQDFFTYLPAFKLVIAGNHKPALRGVDEAIRRRFHLVPFVVTIANPDPDLPDKLRAEWAGILQWMIEGCLAWQRDGLSPPPIVRSATEAYLGDEDALARWVDECCLTGKQHWCSSARLWLGWQTWATTANERTGSRKSFGMALETHGFVAAKSQDVRGYTGLDLKLRASPNED